MTATITIEGLDESEMHDGYSWLATGPRGRDWLIVWQPARDADNIRAWPAAGGKTARWANAKTLDAAREHALEIARKIATRKR